MVLEDGLTLEERGLVDRKISTVNFSTKEREKEAQGAKQAKRRARVGARMRRTKLKSSQVKDTGGVADVEKPDRPGDQPTFTVIYDDTDREIVDTTDLYSDK